MRNYFIGLIAIVSLGVATGRTYGTSAMPQGGMTQAQMAQMMQPQACPMKVQGTDIATEDTKDGLALTFTAKSAENVAELRGRVAQMAKMHESMSGMPMVQGHMTPFTAKYEAVPNGVRLTLTPKDASKLPEFRKQVATHVEQMKKGDCSTMMQGKAAPTND